MAPRSRIEPLLETPSRTRADVSAEAPECRLKPEGGAVTVDDSSVHPGVARPHTVMVGELLGGDPYLQAWPGR